MLKLIRAACAVLALAGAAPLAQAEEPPLTAPVASSPLSIGTSWQMPSRVYGTTREINVWTPPGYDAGTDRYPVVYVIDGGVEQDFLQIAGIATLAPLADLFEPFIVVGVKTYERRKELTSRATDRRYLEEFPATGDGEKFRRFLTNEVTPFIESRYRTGPRRAVIGESLAGLFIVETFLSQPDAFTDYIAVSPSLWWDDRALTKRAASLLANHRASTRRLYLTIGDEPGTMRTGINELVAALRARPPAGLTWKFVDRARSDDHGTIYHGAALDALRQFFGKPRPTYGADPWYLVEGANPPPKPPQ